MPREWRSDRTSNRSCTAVILAACFLFFALFASNATATEVCTPQIKALLDQAEAAGIAHAQSASVSDEAPPSYVIECASTGQRFDARDITSAILEDRFMPEWLLLRDAYTSLDRADVIVTVNGGDNGSIAIESLNQPLFQVNASKSQKWNFLFGELPPQNVAELATFLDRPLARATLEELANTASLFDYIRASGAGEFVELDSNAAGNLYAQLFVPQFRDIDSLREDGRITYVSMNGKERINGFSPLRTITDSYHVLGEPSGAIVRSLMLGGPGSLGGLQIDDVVFAVNEKRISDSFELASALSEVGRGDIRLGVMRNGEALFLNIPPPPEMFSHPKFEEWQSPATILQCSVTAYRDGAGNVFSVVPAPFFMVPNLPGFGDTDELLASLSLVQDEGVFQTLPSQPWCLTNTLSDDFILVPTGLLQTEAARRQVAELARQEILAYVRDATPPDRFTRNYGSFFVVSNAGTDVSTPVVVEHERSKYTSIRMFMGDRVLFSEERFDNNLRSLPAAPTRSPSEAPVIAPAPAAAPPQTGRAPATGQPNVIQTIILAAGNAALFEFGDELYCRIRDYADDEDYTRCTQNARRFIRAADEKYPWLVLIAALFGYIYFAPLGWLYEKTTHSNRDSAKTVFKIYFYSELVEGSISIAGQTLTYQDVSIFWIAALITFGVALVRGGYVAMNHMWRTDRDFRSTVRGMLIFAAMVAVFFLYSTAKAGQAGAVDNLLSKHFNEVVNAVPEHKTAAQLDNAAHSPSTTSYDNASPQTYDSAASNAQRQADIDAANAQSRQAANDAAERARIQTENDNAIARQNQAQEAALKADIKARDERLAAEQADRQAADFRAKQQQDADFAQKRLEQENAVFEEARLRGIDLQQQAVAARKAENEEYFAKLTREQTAWEEKQALALRNSANTPAPATVRIETGKGSLTSPGVPGAAGFGPKVARRADFITDTRGVTTHADPNAIRKSLDDAGYNVSDAKDTAEVGTIHSGVPGNDGPMDVRIMNGQASGGEFKGARVVTTRQGTTDAVKTDGSKFRDNESRLQRRQESHIHLEPKE